MDLIITATSADSTPTVKRTGLEMDKASSRPIRMSFTTVAGTRAELAMTREEYEIFVHDIHGFFDCEE